MVLTTIVYFAMGFIYGAIRDDWNVEESLYFIIVTMTTVGYGYDDHTFYYDGRTKGDVIFGIFFILIGTFAIGTFVLLMYDVIAQWRDDRERSFKNRIIDSLASG